MKATPAPLLAHKQGENSTTTKIYLAVLKNGTIYGFTGLNRDVSFGGITYEADSGFAPSDMQSDDTLAVANMEVTGFFSSGRITQSDINAGFWDGAAITTMEVNYNDLTMGADIVATATLGQITQGRQQVIAEIRSLSQAYQQNVGRVITGPCTHSFCDIKGIKFGAGCSLDRNDWTVSGTVGSVSADGLTIYDAARTESGLTVGTGTGYTSDATGYTTGTTSIAAITGTGTILAGDWILFAGDTNQYLVTTGVSGPGTIVIAGGLLVALPTSAIDLTIVTHQYYVGGYLTFTSGLNTGISVETKTNAVGSVTLELNMPFAISPGDTYTLVAGCDKTKPTCVSRNNMINHGGFWELPGVDRVLLAANRPAPKSGGGKW